MQWLQRRGLEVILIDLRLGIVLFKINNSLFISSLHLVLDDDHILVKPGLRFVNLSSGEIAPLQKMVTGMKPDCFPKFIGKKEAYCPEHNVLISFQKLTANPVHHNLEIIQAVSQDVLIGTDFPQERLQILELIPHPTLVTTPKLNFMGKNFFNCGFYFTEKNQIIMVHSNESSKSLKAVLYSFCPRIKPTTWNWIKSSRHQNYRHKTG